jgi:hypothetical protein
MTAPPIAAPARCLVPPPGASALDRHVLSGDNTAISGRRRGIVARLAGRDHDHQNR